jgi:hypothetical protein
MNRWLIVLAVVTGLVALGLRGTAEAPVTLVIGWVPFLGRVLPRMTVDGPSLLMGGVALLVFGVGLHLAARRWRGGRGWKARWSFAVVVLVCVLFAGSVACVGIVHQVGWLAGSAQPMKGPSLAWWHTDPRGKLLVIRLAITNQLAVNKGQLPPGGTFTPEGGMLHGWVVPLFPYFNYDSRSIDKNLPWNHPKNREAFTSVLGELINPDLRPAPLYDADGYGLNHYAANSHVMGANRSMRLDDISDGTSTTLLIGEVNANFKPWGHPANFRDPAKGVNRSPHGFGGAGRRGGARFLMADGSVRFLSENTSPSILEALATPRGGEAVDEEGLGW